MSHKTFKQSCLHLPIRYLTRVLNSKSSDKLIIMHCFDVAAADLIFISFKFLQWQFLSFNNSSYQIRCWYGVHKFVLLSLWCTMLFCVSLCTCLSVFWFVSWAMTVSVYFRIWMSVCYHSTLFYPFLLNIP